MLTTTRSSIIEELREAGIKPYADDKCHYIINIRIAMSINKFGLPLEKVANSTYYYQWNGLLRNYVRDNALYLTAADFDARSRKIRCVAQPEADTDAVNKRYVETSVNFLRDRQEEYEKKLTALEINMQTLRIAIEELRKILEKLFVQTKDT